VSAGRAHQLVAGALVAEAAVRAPRVTELEICPRALREGVISRRLDAGVPAQCRWPPTDLHARPCRGLRREP
jgi:exopolyphosphatase / guanosine-5'-triphosphate,3'-diphosphate pyrophosphatase